MTSLHTPSGTKDVLPTEASELRLIEDAFRTVFGEFGYGEVRTPTLEYEEVIALSHEASLVRGFQLLDEHGQLLLLRPDLTTPIARLVGSRLRNGLLPHRVCVVSDVFRSITPERGQEREFRQAGVELLGSPLPEADAEVIAVACRSLERAGLTGYRVGVGQVAFFPGLLGALGLDADVQRRLNRELVDKDFVGFRLQAEALGLPADALEAVLTVPDLRGGPEVLEQARRFVRGAEMGAALDHLVAVAHAVAGYGHDDRLLFDFGIVRNLEYYTGIVFEVYAPGVGFTLGGGGRYDRLLASFGAPMPAVGFGMGLERVHAALVEQGTDFGPLEPAVVMVGGLDRWVALAEELRANLVSVFSLAADVGPDQLPQLARQKDIPLLLEPVPGTEGARWTLTDLRGGVTEGTVVAGVVDLVLHAVTEHEGPAVRDTAQTIDGHFADPPGGPVGERA